MGGLGILNASVAGMTNLRFRPVQIGRHIGDYSARPASLCWSIADAERANRTNGQKFDTYQQALDAAAKLNLADRTTKGAF